MAREEGGVLVVIALVLPFLFVMSAGGVSGFTVTSVHRELQTAADQGALAGAAALPPVDPNLIVQSAPFPLPSTDPVYDLLPGSLQNVIPRMGQLVPDPRAVACAVSSSVNLRTGARMLQSFEDRPGYTPSGSTVCPDNRVFPVMDPTPGTSTPLDCTNDLVRRVMTQLGPLQPLVSAILRMPVDHMAPALLSPRFTVDTYARVKPPMYAMLGPAVPGSNGGVTLHARGTAHRRIKNAVVVPILPADTLLIRLGLKSPVAVMTDPVNLNNALRAAQAPLLNALQDADTRLNALMGTLGLPCRNLLANMRQDLRDIYSPPSGPAPTALDLVDASVNAAQQVAARTGIPQPNPADPGSLAGEAFFLIGVSVDGLLLPISAAQIPILDMATVVMTRVAQGDYRAAVVSAANARGAFRASLVA